MVNLRQKDKTHFGMVEGATRPLEAIYRHLDFKPLVFGTFEEISNIVKDFVELAVEYYGVEHLGRIMAVTLVDTIQTTPRRYKTQLAIAAWRG